jgi:UDP-N-acetylglucosamine--N-acetylmuramyl-(pentapeptide) pyrophosphoryl-undecaprenol N-acetylglucosamine transferase
MMKILLSGGGTMGSVSPLLAVKEELSQSSQVDFLWVGTARGPEHQLVEKYNIKFKSIPCGKWRRYFDWRNFFDPLLIVLGFLKSIWIIGRFRPDIILTAGSFVSVPLVWAGAVWRRRILVHQQDSRIGLANRLMVPFALKVTVAYEELRSKFSSGKAYVTGNPARCALTSVSREAALQHFGLDPAIPTLLVMGGGLGAEIINETFIQNSVELTKFCQIIHLLGRGAQSKWLYSSFINNNKRYRAFEFLDEEMALAYAAADVVFSRAGFSSLTELAALGKPAIIMPIPNNQQEENADYFRRQQAVVLVRQEDFAGDYIVNLVRDLLTRPERLKELSFNIYNSLPREAASEYARLVFELIKKD